MRRAIIIPARYESTRFPGKPLAALRGSTGESVPLIVRTIRAAQAAQAGDASLDIVVATDDSGILDMAQAAGVRAVLTPQSCANGTERCAAVLNAGDIEADIIVNLQGDAPLTPPHAITALIAALEQEPFVDVATPMIRCSGDTAGRLRADAAAVRVGGTTVVVNRSLDALYFSKSVVPHGGGGPDCPLFLHIGLYAYRAATLRAYAEAPPSPLERAEGLEQLRFLDRGTAIRMIEIDEPAGGLWEVNNPQDIPIIERALAARAIA